MNLVAIVCFCGYCEDHAWLVGHCYGSSPWSGWSGSVREDWITAVTVFAFAVRQAGSVSAEVQVRQDFRHTVLGCLLHPILLRQPQRLFEHLIDADIGSVAQPFPDWRFPFIGNKASSLVRRSQAPPVPASPATILRPP